MSSSVNEDDGNGDAICFSSDTLKALNQFYQESAEFNLNLKHGVNEFSEDWVSLRFTY